MISASDHTGMIQVPKLVYLKLVQEHQDMTARLLVLEQQLDKLQRLHFGLQPMRLVMRQRSTASISSTLQDTLTSLSK